MIRECVALAIASVCPACSLILDFSDQAAPSDASIDLPYTKMECDYHEPNDTLDTAAAVQITDKGPAAICAVSSGGPEDLDFYKITIGNVVTVTIDVHLMNRPAGDLDLKLYDAQGSLLSQSRTYANDETIVCPGASPPCSALSPGDYVFEVFPAVPGSVNEYSFSIAVASARM